jgi:nitrogen fixation/metabolism regulation signal transduction histidine kinase
MIRGEDYIIAIAPINIQLTSVEGVPSAHLYTLGVAVKRVVVVAESYHVAAFDDNDYLIFTVLAILLGLTLMLSSVIAYQTAHYIIRPLRMLNNKMLNIIVSNEGDIELTNDEESSMELTLLYNEFKDLISAKKFENNNFMQKPDALAVLDLAEACNMFDGSNYKAAGICFNNIGNIQYKNEKYSQAAENFFHAIE